MRTSDLVELLENVHLYCFALILKGSKMLVLRAMVQGNLFHHDLTASLCLSTCEEARPRLDLRFTCITSRAYRRLKTPRCLA